MLIAFFFFFLNSEKSSHIAFDANVSLHANLTFMLPFCVSARADLYLLRSRLIDSRLGPVCSRWNRGGRTLGRQRALFPGLSWCKCTSRSTGPHLRRTKQGLMGVHATKLPSKDTGQGDGRLFAALKKKEEESSFPILPLRLSVCVWKFGKIAITA